MNQIHFKIHAPPAWLAISTAIVVGISATLILGWQSMANVVIESVPALLSIMHLVPLAVTSELAEIWRCIFRMPTNLSSGLRFGFAYLAMVTIPVVLWKMVTAGT